MSRPRSFVIAPIAVLLGAASPLALAEPAAVEPTELPAVTAGYHPVVPTFAAPGMSAPGNAPGATATDPESESDPAAAEALGEAEIIEVVSGAAAAQ